MLEIGYMAQSLTTKRVTFVLFALLEALSFNLFASLNLKSTAFNRNTTIPAKYTCDGDNISPTLFWGKAPAKTKSFVLIVDDVDVPGENWVHWLVFNIPANTWLLENGSLPKEAKTGFNSWGKPGYKGPCPPQGTHHYFFKLYALDTFLSLPKTVQKRAVFRAMRGHVLETSELMGLYSK